MLLLDPEAPSSLLRRGLHLGHRSSGQGGGLVRQIAVAVTLYAGGGGISLLCRAVPRCVLRAHGHSSIRQASRSNWEARATASELGSELSTELRRSCSAGQRRDCPSRW